MRALTLFVCLVKLAAALPSSERWSAMSVKHAWATIPQGWQATGVPSPNHSLRMHIHLKQARFDELVGRLYQISDPAHESYGTWLTKEEVEVLVKPSSSAVDAVTAWLSDHEIDQADISSSPAGDKLSVTLSVAKAERMLGTKYQTFHHAESSTSSVRALTYNLPTELHQHINSVTPTTYFSTNRQTKVQVGSELLIGTKDGQPSDSQSCEFSITLNCLQNLYNTTSYVPQGGPNNTIGITGYLGEFANYADLQSFFKNFKPEAAGSNFSIVQLNEGGNDQNKPGTEANLDIQYTAGLTYPIHNIFYSTGGSPPFNPDSSETDNQNEPYLEWLNFILAQENIPQTISNSYADDEQTVPLDYANTTCNQFAQLAARGSTVLFGSGDNGVGADSCTSNDGSNTVRFQPLYPASCPYVTTVGGTRGIKPERAVSFSGGGFSNYFPAPSYQMDAVKEFLSKQNDSKAEGMFSKSGRAYPDVAAQASNFQVIIGGQISPVSGTSAATPAFAGIVALLNDYRIRNGKPPLGFLNPLLYSTARAGLNDITDGHNPGCGTRGFAAGTGWDPVTGLGTPDFGKLQGLIL